MPKKFPEPEKKEHPKGANSTPKTAAELRADQWAAFKSALEAGDDGAIAQGEVQLGLDSRQVEMCQLALDELTKLQQLVAEGEGAAREAEATRLALSKARGIRPSTVVEAEALARAELDLEQRFSEASRLAARVRIAEIGVAGIRFSFRNLLGPCDESNKGALPASILNRGNELGLHKFDPLGPNQPAEKRRRILVAKSDRHLASKPTA